MRNHLVRNPTRVAAYARGVERRSAVITLRRYRRRFSGRSVWASGRLRYCATRSRRWRVRRRQPLRIHLSSRYIRLHEQARRIGINQSDVLPFAQTAIPPRGLIEAIGEREGFSLPSKTRYTIPDGAEQD